MTRSHVVRLILAAALLGGAPACRSGNPYAVGQENGATLVVRNDNFSDMDVYVVADGLPSRIGTVTGNSSARFGLSESLVRGLDFRVVASPIGGNGRASSGQLSVSAGQTVYFNVAPVLRQSTASVR